MYSISRHAQTNEKLMYYITLAIAIPRALQHNNDVESNDLSCFIYSHYTTNGNIINWEVGSCCRI